MKVFQSNLIQWYRSNKRDLPWRLTQDPFFIWLSEVILQQTRVNQGLPYYMKFCDRFQNVSQLAAASEDEILKLWQGLGYYSRARNMHQTAQRVVEQYHGIFPSAYDELIQLKGIGPYTAAAISSFSANEARAVVDGNVIRVLSRVFDIDQAPDLSATRKVIDTLAAELLHPEWPGLHNQAMMELGALICTPANPNCPNCPLAIACKSRALQNQHERPVPKSKTRITKRYFHYIIPVDGNSLYLQKRTQKDIWQGLYEFPLIEAAQSLHIDDLNVQIQKMYSKKFPICPPTAALFEKKHILSHQHIFARFFYWPVKRNVTIPSLEKIPQNTLITYPVSRLLDLFLNNVNLHSMDRASK